MRLELFPDYYVKVWSCHSLVVVSYFIYFDAVVECKCVDTISKAPISARLSDHFREAGQLW